MRALDDYVKNTRLHIYFFKQNLKDDLFNIYVCDPNNTLFFDSYPKEGFPWFIKNKTLLQIFKKGQHIFLKNREIDRFSRCASLNLSWMPPVVYKKLMSNITKSQISSLKSAQTKSVLIEFSIIDFLKALYFNTIKRYVRLFMDDRHKP